MKRTKLCALVLLCLTPSARGVNTIYETGFEPLTFAVGELNGQDGWVAPAGNGYQIENSGPLVGTQAMRIRAVPAPVPSGAVHAASFDASGQVITLSSRFVFTSGNRSEYEFNSLFGSSGFIGGLRVLPTNELSLVTSLGSQNTGVFADFSFSTISISFDFTTGFASATYKGSSIASGVAFDPSNNMINQFAVGRVFVAGTDAVQIDQFSVVTEFVTPEPATASLAFLGLAALVRRRKRAGWRRCGRVC